MLCTVLVAYTAEQLPNTTNTKLVNYHAWTLFSFDNGDVVVVVVVSIRIISRRWISVCSVEVEFTRHKDNTRERDCYSRHCCCAYPDWSLRDMCLCAANRERMWLEILDILV